MEKSKKDTPNQLAREPDVDESEDRLYSIGDLASEFGVSTRAIRFYETKRLIAPRRVGSNRIYGRRDHARLAIILRGKRLGFTLEEIRQYLQLYDSDPDHTTQIRHLLEKVEHTIADLEQKQSDIHQTLVELQDIRNQCIAGLNQRSDHNGPPGAE